ncbi:MAG TPA: class II aldolase/adducin family protein [Roseiflexaceae bacterium]|nr:class II aldolase/adducin family protein [Roseiflexaceae bacterium]HMP41443.1 class II aldolase/adducin family protein [Roseiflexaceae bacterium]
MHQDTWTPLMGPTLGTDEQLNFTIAGDANTPFLSWFVGGLQAALARQGHAFLKAGQAESDAPAEQLPPVRLVLNVCDIDNPRPIHRRGQGTFVVTIVEGAENQRDIMRAAYPLIVRSLSNMVIYNTLVDGVLESHFVTIEQGHYTVRQGSDEQLFFDLIYRRIQPLACSHLVINNEFAPTLPEALWQGDEATAQISLAGKKLDTMGLLPAAIPIQEYLSERELRHVKRLYGIGGLSYGNLSARALHDASSFWMSASGVDKGKLETVGRDILLVTGYEPSQLLIRLSVPPHVEPRRVSVDAIEHYMIYREHPEVGAIVHIHAWWRDPIPSTEVNYPCGTYELASEVAELVRQAPDPSRAVIGLKNHGLTITGHSIDEIFQRIDGMIVPQVPMS